MIDRLVDRGINAGVVLVSTVAWASVLWLAVLPWLPTLHR